MKPHSSIVIERTEVSNNGTNWLTRAMASDVTSVIARPLYNMKELPTQLCSLSPLRGESVT
jgi:hypothetical protein